MDNKSFRRWSQIGEWIAGYESQLRIGGPVEDLHIIRINDLDCIDDIPKCPIGSRQEDAILRPEITQWPKERVTMSRNADVPHGARQSSTIDVPSGHSKNTWSRAFENHDRSVKTRNLDSSDRLSRARRNYHERTRKGSSTD